MNKALYRLFTATLLTLLMSCDVTGLELPGSEEGEDFAANVIPVESDISSAATWQEGKVYYIDKLIRVTSGGTLVIEPGAIVKFSAYGELLAEPGSRIDADGLDLKPIIFTSVFDNSAGGDSILNDGSAQPLKGDWRSIEIESGAVGSEFRHCHFLYGGKARGAVLLIAGRATVDSCVFRDNLGGHPYDSNLASATLDASGADSQTVITSNLFYRNLWPLAINCLMNLDNSNIFSFDEDNDIGTPEEVNTHQGIYIFQGDISGTVSWAETEVPLCFFDSLLRVTDTGTLTIGNGAVIKNSNADFQFEYGSVINRTGVLFTSYRDDLPLGDTNGDGTLSTPSDGDWTGIEVEDGDGNFTYLPNDSAILYSLEGV